MNDEDKCSLCHALLPFGIDLWPGYVIVAGSRATGWW